MGTSDIERLRELLGDNKNSSQEWHIAGPVLWKFRIKEGLSHFSKYLYSLNYSILCRSKLLKFSEAENAWLLNESRALAYYHEQTCFDLNELRVWRGRGSAIAFEGKILQIKDGRLKALVFIKQLTVESQVCTISKSRFILMRVPLVL